MNYQVIRFVLGWVLKLEACLMLLPVLIGLIYREKHVGLLFLIVAVMAFLVGEMISHEKPDNMAIYQKEGFVSVGASWIIMGLVGAIPFVLTGEIPRYIDAVFEIVSGFTTTGSSILPDVEALSHASLFWRSFSHWIGGMGVLVFILMLIPSGSGGSHMNLMRAESPGPEVSKFVPKVQNTAKILYKIYIFMTLLQMVILLLTGMPWFDAVCLTFGTAGTGGFGVLNSSVASYSIAQQWIITLFMIAFGVNFSWYYLIICRRPKDALRMEEVRAYLLVILVAGMLIFCNVRDMYGSLEETLRAVFFQVGSIITTTGFSTVDFDLWPSLSKTILLALMLIGACAGSTGGGMKVSRILIVCKEAKEEMHRMVHPRSVRRVRMDGHVIQEDTLRTLKVFVMLYFLIFAVSVLIVSKDGFSFDTNFSAVCATLNNIGPGIGGVGPTCNFSMYSTWSKIVLIFDMLAGRLEIFPIVLLLNLETWKPH